MKCKFSQFVIGVLVVVGILSFSGVCLWRLTNILVAPKECAKCENVDAFKQAYEMLSTSQSAWMTIIGIFGAIFGLVIPGVGYLFQRVSIENERKEIMSALEDAHEQSKREINMLKNKIESQCEQFAVERESLRKDVWYGIGRVSERTACDDATLILKDEKKDVLTIANYILQIQQCLEAYLTADRCADYVRIVRQGMLVEEHILQKNPNEWQSAINMVRKNGDHLFHVADLKKVKSFLDDFKAEYVWVQDFLCRL